MNKDSYERQFSVSAPVDRAWNAMTDPEELEVWFAGRFESGGLDANSQAETIGGPVGFQVLEFDVHEKLRYRQWAASPDRGIDVTVVFESTETGTRITFTASGFGGESVFQTDSTRRGMDEALADLVTYLNRGISFTRHKDNPARGWLGLRLAETFEGGVVDDIEPGSCADRLGLRTGDLILHLGGASVFSNAEMAFFQRTHEPGDEVEVVWARGNELMRGREKLGVFDGRAFARQA